MGRPTGRTPALDCIFANIANFDVQFNGRVFKMYCHEWNFEKSFFETARPAAELV